MTDNVSWEYGKLHTRYIVRAMTADKSAYDFAATLKWIPTPIAHFG